MDFTIPDELVELKERTERFVREDIMPRENDPRLTPHGPTEAFRRELVALAHKAGLVSPHVGREWGGLGLDHRGKAIVFEAAKPTCISWSRSPTSGRRRNGCGRWLPAPSAPAS
jgi:acyl-CoA dehydrogenase